MAVSVEIHHGLETPHPIRPAPGYFRLEGWALIRGADAPTLVRLTIGDTHYAPEAVLDRPDVAAEFPSDRHALRTGFRFLQYLPFGLHTGSLEASVDGTIWHRVRTLAIPVSSHPLLGAVEKPDPGTFIREPIRVQGWCFHPEFNLATVALRFGNIEAACDYGRERADVAARFPQHPAVGRAGFITSENLPRGSGKLRLRVETSCGRNYFLDSALRGDIKHGTDPTGSPLSTVRTPLTVPPAEHSRRPRPAGVRAAPPPGPRNILFVLYGDFTCNSALHVAAIANELIDRGYDCVVAGPSHKETITTLPRARFMALEFDELEDLPDYFVDRHGPSLVHVWTPREIVRKFTERIRAAYDVPVFIHLEDNERELLENRLDRSTDELLALPPAELDALIPDHLSHPRRSLDFLNSAAGVTTIVDRLREAVPTDRPALTFWPAANEAIFRPQAPNPELRKALGIRDTDTVLFYHGNVHASNAAEVTSLYKAVALLNQRGRRTYLIRTGRDDAERMVAASAEITSSLLHLGHVHSPKFLPELMRLADYFVQPGSPGAFNDYRFPSKLPEFFAIGRPVILPASNLGRFVRHCEDAFVLPHADAESIAAAVSLLYANPELAARLATGAIAFAAEHFSWRRATDQVLRFFLTHSRLAVA